MYHVVSLQHIFRLSKYESVVLDLPELVKLYEELYQKEEKVLSWGCFIPWAAASHQLSLTSLASNCNIVAAGDKFNNNSNSHKDPGSAPQTLHRQPDNGRRKSFLLSRIFKKPKDQDNESDSEDNSAPIEKEELLVTETKKVRQNKQTPAP